MTGIIFDIRRYSINDGPGIRTTVFFKGCPLRCPWCHNPEGQSFQTEIMLRPARCLEGCLDCVAACPPGALTRAAEALALDRATCDRCGRCADVCPTRAIEVVGRRVTPDEVIGEIEKDRVFYETSAGGATFSGGEPLAQADFLAEVLDGCRRLSIQTAVDTCGYVPPEVVAEVAGRADLFLFDLKIMDNKKHEDITGQPNATVLENLKRIAELGRKIIIRLPLLAGVNDDESNLRQIADFLLTSGASSEISLLPYHKLGLEKRRGLGNSPRTAPFAAPSEKALLRIRQDLEALGFRVSRGE
jgi:pyruvate formate lyase activating enzyme